MLGIIQFQERSMLIVKKKAVVIEIETEASRRILVEHFLDHAGLTSRERRTLEMWMADTSFDKIGEAYGVTKERAKEVYKQGLTKLRAYTRKLEKEELRREWAKPSRGRKR